MSELLGKLVLEVYVADLKRLFSGKYYSAHCIGKNLNIRKKTMKL